MAISLKSKKKSSSNRSVKAIVVFLFIGFYAALQLFLSSQPTRFAENYGEDGPFVLGLPDYIDHNNEPLNILVIFPDDWRYDAIGDARPGVVFTPFLTDLAKKGVRFTQNFVTTSICWISRATLFTGRYASQHASIRLPCANFMEPHNWNGTWPYLLQKFGDYYVGHVGKWQFHNKPHTLYNWSSLFEGKHWHKELHAAEKAENEAIRFLRERPKDKKFALTVAFYPPKPVGNSAEPGAQWQPAPRYRALYENHTFVPPYNFTEAFKLLPSFLTKGGVAMARFQTRFKTNEMYQESLKNYLALVSHVDYATSKIVAELEKQGILNKTMIIVTADNGMMLGSHGLAGKWHPFEDSIRVPLVIYDPRLPESKAGLVDDSMTLNIDLATTIVKAANITPDPRMQGNDISDLYLRRGKVHPITPSNSSWREDFFYEFPLPFPPSTALITKRYKYIKWPMNDMEQLFDLQDDQFELKDLNLGNPNNTDHQKLMEELRRRHYELQDLYTEPDKPKDPCNK